MKHTRHVSYWIDRKDYRPRYIGDFKSRRLARRALKVWLRYDISGDCAHYSVTAGKR